MSYAEGSMKTKTKWALGILLVVGMPVVWYVALRAMHDAPLPDHGTIHTPQGTDGPTGIM